MISGMRPALPRPIGLPRALCACALLLAFSATPAAAKSYSADRFDAIVRVLPDGTLDVTETVVFRFEEGTFREVFREIPVRRTDGIEILRAEMQGEPLPFGTESGTAEVRERNGRVRVVWRFRPIDSVSRTFVLRYRVKGAVREEAGSDLLHWRAIPGEHGYAIAASTIRFELPVSPAPPSVDSRRTGAVDVAQNGNTVTVSAERLRSNGWIETTLRFPAGSILAAPPAWQQRSARINAQAGSWIAGAAAVIGAGLVLLIAWRQSYDRPPDAETPQIASPYPPDDLSPALGGVVAANGRPSLEHAMAALFALADRGDIEIRESRRGVFSQRVFELTRRPSHAAVVPYEQQILDVAFGHSPSPGDTTSLSQARNRLVRRFRKVAAEMQQALASAGLLDQARSAIRKRYHTAAVVTLIVAVLSLIMVPLLIENYGPWPLVFSVALFVVALASLIFGATITPLSNEGVRRGHRWRAYRGYLTKVARGRVSSTGLLVTDVLPVAIALGMAGAWSKFLKTQRVAAPAWFHALPASGDDGAFVAFVAYGGASAGGGGHGGGGAGGAAGGGASGAG